MKKIMLLFLSVISLFGLGIVSYADVSVYANASDPGFVDVNQVAAKFTNQTELKGLSFRSGLIGNYYAVKPAGTSGVYKDVIICYLTDVYEVYSSNSFTVQRKYINDAVTFASFDQDIPVGYGYTLLSGFGLCSNEKSNLQDYGMKFYSNGANRYLYSDNINENSSSYTFNNIPTGKRSVALVLKGDIVYGTVKVTQYQDLWWGDSEVWTSTVNVFIMCNTRAEVVYEAA